MIYTDVRFGSGQIELLQKMVGKVLIRYMCDPFLFTSSVYGIVGFVIDENAYSLTNTTQTMDYYGSTEDVAVMKLQEVPEKSIHSFVADNTMITTPVGKMIKCIDVVNEHQSVYRKGTQEYDVQLTRGLIFHFEDDSELSFEKNVWFSEEITIQKGNNLIDYFSPTTEFSDDWDGDYSGQCSRTIQKIGKISNNEYHLVDV